MSHRRDERGVVLVLFALTLVVMLIFAGFMVDLGAWYYRQERLHRPYAEQRRLTAGHKSWSKACAGESAGERT